MLVTQVLNDDNEKRLRWLLSPKSSNLAFNFSNFLAFADLWLITRFGSNALLSVRLSPSLFTLRLLSGVHLSGYLLGKIKTNWIFLLFFLPFFFQTKWERRGFLSHICISRRGDGSPSDGQTWNTCFTLQFPNATNGLPTGERATGRQYIRWPQAGCPLGAMLALPRAKTLWNATRGSEHDKHFMLCFRTIRQRCLCSM